MPGWPGTPDRVLEYWPDLANVGGMLRGTMVPLWRALWLCLPMRMTKVCVFFFFFFLSTPHLFFPCLAIGTGSNESTSSFLLKCLQNVPGPGSVAETHAQSVADFYAFMALICPLRWLDLALGEGWCSPSPLPISAQ